MQLIKSAFAADSAGDGEPISELAACRLALACETRAPVRRTVNHVGGIGRLDCVALMTQCCPFRSIVVSHAYPEAPCMITCLQFQQIKIGRVLIALRPGQTYPYVDIVLTPSPSPRGPRTDCHRCWGPRARHFGPTRRNNRSIYKARVKVDRRIPSRSRRSDTPPSY